jgi:hypothetical protein
MNRNGVAVASWMDSRVKGSIFGDLEVLCEFYSKSLLKGKSGIWAEFSVYFAD